MSQEPSDTIQERTNLITPQGYRALTEEFNFLKMTERPRIVEEVHFAAKQGDRSENAEYQYGKKRLREIDRRTRFLTKRIESARIIDPTLQNPDKIRFGATVILADEDGKEKKYQIVGEDESDIKLSRISWKSPLAKALLGSRTGQFIEVKAPKGDLEYEIIDYYYLNANGEIHSRGISADDADARGNSNESSSTDDGEDHDD
jgi:transcription elongation factor GreB